MSDRDLGVLLDSLVSPRTGATGLRFTAAPIPGSEPHRLGVAPNGNPALLLVAAPGRVPAKRLPTIELEHLTVQHDVLCRIIAENEVTTEAPFTVIQCTSGDATLRRQFLGISSSLLLTLGPAPTAVNVQRAVAALVELFRALSLPQRKSTQGLWAELFVISQGADPGALVRAWHATPEDRYDFNAGSVRIEVKSSAARVRRHRFALEQLKPPLGTQVVVASMFTERSGSGVTLAELVAKVRTSLATSPEFQIRVERVVAQTMGQGYSRALEMGFDWQLATESLAFFAHKEVPRISGDLPWGISEVSFVADLSASPALCTDVWSEGLLAAARPSQ
jgi:putative PD-(D/E)XK family protein DUF4420